MGGVIGRGTCQSGSRYSMVNEGCGDYTPRVASDRDECGGQEDEKSTGDGEGQCSIEGSRCPYPEQVLEKARLEHAVHSLTEE